MQQALDNLSRSAGRWGMEFNVPKCKVIHLGHNSPQHEYLMEPKTGAHYEGEGYWRDGVKHAKALSTVRQGGSNRLVCTWPDKLRLSLQGPPQIHATISNTFTHT